MIKLSLFVCLAAVATVASAQSTDGDVRMVAAQTRWARATQPTFEDLTAATFDCISLKDNDDSHLRFDSQIEAISSSSLTYNTQFFRPTGRELKSDVDRDGGFYEIRKESPSKFLVNKVITKTVSGSQIPESAGTIPEQAPTRVQPQTSRVVIDTRICVPRK